MKVYRVMDSFEKGGDNTSLMVECKVIYPQDTENSIYLKSYSRSTKVRVLNSENLINRLRDGEEIIAYGIKNPETSEEEEATIKKEGEVTTTKEEKATTKGEWGRRISYRFL